MEQEQSSERHVLVLLPGLDGTGRLFAPLRRELEPHFDSMVVAYPADRLRNYDELSADVAKQLPSSQFTLVAESFSGPVALKVAARNPPGLTAVVLCASFAACPRPWLAWVFGGFTGGWCFRAPIPDWVLRMLAAGRDAGQALCAAVRSAIRAVDPEVLAFRLREVMHVDATDCLLECPVPLFYLNGTEDRLLGGAAIRDIRAIRPDVRLIDVKGPHMLLQAAPEACACEIAAAIRGCSGDEV